MCFCLAIGWYRVRSSCLVARINPLRALPPKRIFLELVRFKRAQGGNMKKFLIGLFVLATLSSTAFAQEKPRIGVIRFTNNTHASWWHGGTGSELQDMLIAELAATESFSILERKELDKVIGELKLGESGLIDQRTKSELGKLKGAKYLIAGTVSSFEENISGSDAGISFMGVSVGGKKMTAYLAVDVKLIDVETGEIVESKTIEANSSGGGLRVSG